MTILDEIPREHLIAMLKEAVFYSAGSEKVPQGYSLDTNEGTAIRDVVYRDEPLYPTSEEAIVAHWKRHYRKAKP